MKFYNFVNKANEIDLYINGEIVADQDKDFLEMWGYECFAPTDFKEQLAECNGKPINVYATGGLASSIVEYCKHKVTLDADMVLKGLYIIYKNNK